MKRSTRGTLAAAGFLAFAFAGCNAILDNERGTLAEDDVDLDLPAPSPIPTPTTPPLPPPDSGAPGASPPPPLVDAGPPGCPAGQRLCSSACVSVTDPLHGCGSASCTPCPSIRSSSGCAGGACVIAACTAGYADCNASVADGCETDLSKTATCGACNAVCGPAAPVCAPTGATFQCTTGCKPGSPLLCGGECVDPQTSVNHCGGCNVKCPVLANATTACAAGACTLTCNPAFRACGGACVAQTNPGACGPGCIACAAPPNAVATCAADTCGFTCAAGFGSCDADPVNGCETNLLSDRASCGACGAQCGLLQTCIDGVCRFAL